MSLPNVSEMLEKPSTWLIFVSALLTTSVGLMLSRDAEWSTWGFYTMCVGFVGRLWTMGSMDGAQKWFRRCLWMIPALLFWPVLAHQLRRGPDGHPTSILGHVVGLVPALINDVRGNLASPLPLKGTVSKKSELLGAVETDYLSLTNVEEKALVFVRCELHSRSNVDVLKLPVLIKPYETVEVELKTSRGKHHFSSGDVIVVECEGYDKPLTISSP